MGDRWRPLAYCDSSELDLAIVRSEKTLLALIYHMPLVRL